MTEGPVVIIGAGECGTSLAVELVGLGWQGGIHLVGAEPGPPHERPPLSKALLEPGHDGSPPPAIDAAGRLDQGKVDVRTGLAAKAIDRDRKQVVLGDGTTLAYGRLVLATGARPRRLPVAEGLDNIHYLRSLADARRLVAALKRGGRLAVIGGGFIGLEVAAAARARGLPVSVVEAQSRILARGVSEDIANALAGLHRAHGVNLVTGRMIAGFTQDGSETMIRLADGGVLAADHVLVGIGAEPDTGLAAAAGLAIDNGIAVDTTLTTSDPHIMAAGDCASSPIAVYGGRRVRLESWRHARDQARLAAAIITGSPLPEPAVPWFWSDQFGQGLQVAGLVDEGVRQIRRDAGDNVLVTFHLAGDGRLVAACGLGPGQSVARDIRLAEMMIARHARPDPAALADPGVKLKSMLT